MPRVTFTSAEHALTQLLHIRDGYDRAEDVVGWAQVALAEGQDSESLRILAGLGPNPNAFEANEHFERALDELGIERGSGEDRRARYVRLLCDGIVKRTLEPVAALTELVEECDVDSGGWWELYDAATLCTETARLLYPSIVEAGLETAIRDQARAWLSAGSTK